MGKIDLKALSEKELVQLMHSEGLPGYRTRQMMQWIYERGVSDIDDITVFSKSLRESLKAKTYISSLAPIDTMRSIDGTIKMLFALEDGNSIESVLIPDNDRLTLCVSSQVGCQMGCAFCRTAGMGFRRNLEAHEIVDQLVRAREFSDGLRISNIVFMGMGEPLMNVDNVVEAIVRMNTFMKLSRRKITVSTSGVVEGIRSLPRLLSRYGIYVNLAISLNATDDEVRSRIMPVNRRSPIKDLMAAVRAFPLPRTRMVTFEYVLIRDLNDTRKDAARLAGLIRGIPNKVNIIPMNEFEGCALKSPSPEHVEQFKEWLTAEGLTALVRKSKGQDILASCGQLATKKASDD